MVIHTPIKRNLRHSCLWTALECVCKNNLLKKSAKNSLFAISVSYRFYFPLVSIRCLIDAMNCRLKKLFYSAFIWVNLCLFTIVESAPHQISKEHCKHLNYCNYRGICEVRNSTSGSDVEYFCQCYEVWLESWFSSGIWIFQGFIGNDCIIGKLTHSFHKYFMIFDIIFLYSWC